MAGGPRTSGSNDHSGLVFFEFSDFFLPPLPLDARASAADHREFRDARRPSIPPVKVKEPSFQAAVSVRKKQTNKSLNVAATDKVSSELRG